MIDYKEGNQVFLNFQAADRWCKVFVNKYYVGEHKGGYSAFTFPITQYCRQGEENELDIFWITVPGRRFLRLQETLRYSADCIGE